VLFTLVCIGSTEDILVVFISDMKLKVLSSTATSKYSSRVRTRNTRIFGSLLSILMVRNSNSGIVVVIPHPWSYWRRSPSIGPSMEERPTDSKVPIHNCELKLGEQKVSRMGRRLSVYDQCQSTRRVPSDGRSIERRRSRKISVSALEGLSDGGRCSCLQSCRG
jgi:hypothetical protein